QWRAEAVADLGRAVRRDHRLGRGLAGRRAGPDSHPPALDMVAGAAAAGAWLVQAGGGDPRPPVPAAGQPRRGPRAPWGGPAAPGLRGVTGITIATGGDNLAAYPPVFATISTSAAAITLAVFAVGVAVWCLVGAWLVSHHRVTDGLPRWGHWIIPAVYILIGV